MAGHSLLVDELPPAGGPPQAAPQTLFHQVQHSINFWWFVLVSSGDKIFWQSVQRKVINATQLQTELKFGRGELEEYL